MLAKKPVSLKPVFVVLLAGMTTYGTGLLHRAFAGRGVTAMAQRGMPRELAFQLPDGRMWRLGEHRGQVVAINLWATWCGPCRTEVPTLTRLSTDPELDGFQVVGVSLDTGTDREQRVHEFVTTFHLVYPTAFPEPMSQIEEGLDGIPTTLLFDRHGRVAKVYVGELEDRSLRSDVTTLLRER